MAAPAATAGSRAASQAAAGAATRAMRLTRRKPRIRWYKWERALLERFIRADQEEALLAAPDSDAYYYSYWDCPDAHLPVLQDAPYQAAWAAALEAAAPLLKDAVVLDVGCGLGTLAMAAARAGAKHVYAVDASQGAADMARKLVAANGLADRVTVLHGRAEHVELPVRRVDVLLCDWMGSMLLHDSLLPALIRVRDRWLAPGGVILPDAAQLFVTGIDDRPYLAEQSRLWGGGRAGAGAALAAVAGGGAAAGPLSLKPLLASVVKHPRVDGVPSSALVTDTQQLLALDLYRASLADLTFRRRVRLTAQRGGRTISGLAAHFDVAWTMRRTPGGAAPAAAFSTGPAAPSTSWLQTVLSFPRAIKVEAGEALGAEFRVAPRGAPPGRMLDVTVEVEFKGMAATVAYQLKR